MAKKNLNADSGLVTTEIAEKAPDGCPEINDWSGVNPTTTLRIKTTLVDGNIQIDCLGGNSPVCLDCVFFKMSKGSEF